MVRVESGMTVAMTARMMVTSGESIGDEGEDNGNKDEDRGSSGQSSIGNDEKGGHKQQGWR